MDDLKQIIAKNLVELRKRKKYTQLDLANELQYSDKAISKWEKGDSLPDIEVLYKICNLYSVTLDFLTHEGSFEEKQEYVIKAEENKNKFIISLLSVSLVWLIAIILFVYQMVLQQISMWTWFVWAVPLSAIVLLIFNSLWGRRKWRFVILSILLWSILAGFFSQAIYANFNLWPVFLLGIPAQIAIGLWSQLKHRNRI